jgi:hypothetical protein
MKYSGSLWNKRTLLPTYINGDLITAAAAPFGNLNAAMLFDRYRNRLTGTSDEKSFA